MDDPVKIYDTRRGPSWIARNGYGTITGTKNSKKSNSGNWGNFLTGFRKNKTVNGSCQSPEVGHSVMPFSVIPVDPGLAYMKYRSLSVASNPYLSTSRSSRHHHPHHPAIYDYSLEQHDLHVATIRSPPKTSKRSSLFDSHWETSNAPPPMHHHHVHHSECTCSGSSHRSGLSARYPEQHSSTTYINRSEMKALENGASSMLSRSVRNSENTDQRNRRDVLPMQVNAMSNKLTRNSYTTLGGGFMRALRKNAKDPFPTASSRKPSVTAYDLIEQQFGKQIEDDDLSDNILETGQSSALKTSSNGKCTKSQCESVSKSYSRTYPRQVSKMEKKTPDLKSDEDKLSSGSKMRIGGQGVTFHPWNQTLPKSSSSCSSDQQKSSNKKDMNFIKDDNLEDFSVPDPDYDDSDPEEKKLSLRFRFADEYPSEQFASQGDGNLRQGLKPESRRCNSVSEVYAVSESVSSVSSPNGSINGSVKKSILKKFSSDPKNTNPNNNSSPSRPSIFEEENDDEDVFSKESKVNQENDEDEKQQQQASQHFNPSPRKSPRNLLKLRQRKNRKHVTFRSPSDDASSILDQINEPILEEEEPLYDDVEEETIDLYRKAANAINQNSNSCDSSNETHAKAGQGNTIIAPRDLHLKWNERSTENRIDTSGSIVADHKKSFSNNLIPGAASNKDPDSLQTKNETVIYKASSHSSSSSSSSFYSSSSDGIKSPTNPHKDYLLPSSLITDSPTTNSDYSQLHATKTAKGIMKVASETLHYTCDEMQSANLNSLEQGVGMGEEEESTDPDEDDYEMHKSTFTVSVVNRIDENLTEDQPNAVRSCRKKKREDEELKCECNKIVIDVSSGNVYETIQGQDQSQEHIYEEVQPMGAGFSPSHSGSQTPEEIRRSMFDGASKDQILEYLQDAKVRVEVLIGNDRHEEGICASNQREAVLVSSPELNNVEQENARGDHEEPKNTILALLKSRSGVAGSADNLLESTNPSCRRNRTSNVSNSSTDSTVTTSSSLEDDLRSGPLITSSVSMTQLVERNDSGVGTETSKPTRLRRSSSAILGEVEQRCTDCEQVLDFLTFDDSPGMSFFPLTCTKCDKKRLERKEIISEFVETEFKYGRDLRIIREEFYRPVEVAGLLTKEQIKSVFLNLDELIGVNSRFSEKLQDALDIATEQGDEEYTTVNLGRLFMDSSSMLLAFETYCSRQGSASLILAHLEKEKELLRIFLRVSQMENTLLRRMNLSAFLMVPVQRVTKYPLLLNRLYKVTPYHHRDREALKAAQQKVELHLEHINQQTKCAPNKIWRRISNLSVANRRLPAVLEDIGNMKLRKAALDSLKWAREDTQFVLCGKLLFAPVSETPSKKGRTIKFSPIHALLVAHGTPTEHYRPDLAESDDPLKTFSAGHTGITEAALVLIKDKSSRYTLCHEPFQLTSCIIRMESEDDDVFEVHDMNDKDSFLFKAESSDISRQWFKHLGYHSRDLGGWRRRRNALANIMMVKR